MRKLLLLVAAVFISFSLLAQMPGMGGGKSMPAIGRIFGKLVDSTGKAISDASVILLQSKYDSIAKKNKEVLLKGVTTQANGDFNFEELPIFKPLKLKVTAMGHKPIEQSIALQPKFDPNAPKPNSNQMPDFSAMASAFEKDLGKVVMKTDLQELGNVTVTATNTRLKMDIDKKVFNVDQNIATAGGTALDVMRNVPSVNVDIDGNVTLRNATPQIYIDGRPTTLTLDQIPADAIESVEVITNPSAKYDASGGNAGILNIILKKNKKSGYNGNVTAGVDKRGALNGGASFSVRQNKINFSLSGFANQMKNHTTNSTDIRSLLTSPDLLVTQNDKGVNHGGFLFGRAGLDYFATNKTTFSLGFIKVHGAFNPHNLMKIDSTFDGGPYVSYSERSTQTHREFNAFGFQGGFKHSFSKKGEEITADANVFSGKNGGEAFYNTDIYPYQGTAKNGNTQQHILNAGSNKFVTIQTDYVTPFKGAAKLEAGLRAQLRTLSNSQENYYYDVTSGDFNLIPSATSNYKTQDNVYAGYVSFSNNIKDFGYKIGLRGESSNYEGELIGTKEKFSNNYPISLFPSVFLSQKLKGRQELQLSYTRRVNRPFFMQIIPFIDSSDQLNWSRGNAGLKPEFTNSLEASYTKTYKGTNTFLASVYFKQSTDMITRLIDTVTVGGVKHPINTYANANSSHTEGIELTTQNTVKKWWDLNANVNIYNSKINTDNITGTSQDAMWSWFAKINNNFKLPKNFKLQLSGTYQSKSNLPVNQNGGFMGGPPMGAQSAAQGYIKANYGIDAGIQKSFLKKNTGSVTFNVNDIFRTRQYEQYSESAYYIQTTHRMPDVPMMRLTFSFRFGQMDMSLFKRKNMKGESEGAQGAMQGIQQ
jgi:outer membrane receptor protein involved in Fe transport